MCDKRSSVKVHILGKDVRVDACLRKTIININGILGLPTVACCCGHGRYPETILVEDESGEIYEYNTSITISKQPKRTYYVRDVEGYYYIPKLVQTEAVS